MATTPSISLCSYGIILPDSRHFIIVNAQPGQYVDKIIVKTSSTDVHQRVSMIKDYNDFISMFNDVPSYKTLRVEFTMNIDEGSVATARVLDAADDDEERQEAVSMVVARYIIGHESRCANGMIDVKPLKRPFEIVGKGKEKKDEEEKQEDEICAICLKEYEADEVMRRLECKHGYHAECISKWLLRKNVCPLCGADTITWL